MNLNELAPVIIALFVNIPGIVSLYFLWKKSKIEAKQNDVDLADKYEKMASRAAQTILDKSVRIDELEKKVNRIEELEKMVEKLSCELQEEKAARIDATKRALLFENWASRLVVQISRANMTPVSLTEDKDQLV